MSLGSFRGKENLKRKSILLLALLLSISLLVMGCGGGNTQPPAGNGNSNGENGNDVPGETLPGGVINIQGSDTMVNLGQALAEYYMDEVNENANLAVTGGGSGTGIAAMINDNTDIAQSSRAMKQEELDNALANGVTAHEFIVAQDGMAIVVQDSNPIEKLTVQQLKDIFTGNITNWSQLGWDDGGTISVYSRQSNSGTYVYFNENIMDGEDWANDTRFMPGSAAMADGIDTDTAGIGYFGVGYVKPVGNKVVNISRGEGQPYVSPLDASNVNDGSYPIARPLFFYVNGVPEGLGLHYLEWVLSPQGQDVILDSGFYSIIGDQAAINEASFRAMGIR